MLSPARYRATFPRSSPRRCAAGRCRGWCWRWSGGGRCARRCDGGRGAVRAPDGSGAGRDQRAVRGGGGARRRAPVCRRAMIDAHAGRLGRRCEIGCAVSCSRRRGARVDRAREARPLYGTGDAGAAGRLFKGRVQNRNRDGRSFWAEMDMQPLRDEHGRSPGSECSSSTLDQAGEAGPTLRSARGVGPGGAGPGAPGFRIAVRGRRQGRRRRGPGRCCWRGRRGEFKSRAPYARQAVYRRAGPPTGTRRSRRSSASTVIG